jgi:hypothetical protein
MSSRRNFSGSAFRSEFSNFAIPHRFRRLIKLHPLVFSSFLLSFKASSFMLKEVPRLLQAWPDLFEEVRMLSETKKEAHWEW